jgi:pimeloyl-ACP methyl ester carboxylesterase
LSVAYREAGTPANPTLVLLHGFPSSSHQYRDLIRSLADRFHLIAPDYPGFGLSDVPDPAAFPYTFDRLAQVIDQFLAIKGFDRYGLFVQDYGGPVGFRPSTETPTLEWLIIQNSNAYESASQRRGMGFCNALWKTRHQQRRSRSWF